MGGVVSRKKKHLAVPLSEPEQSKTTGDVNASLTKRRDSLPTSQLAEEDPQAILQERAEARLRSRAANQIPDPVTPLRIKKTLADFLDKEFDSPAAMQAAVDAYATEVALLEREGQVVSRLLTTGSGGSGASVNDIRGAIDTFLSNPSRDMDALLDQTARLLVHVDVDLPVAPMLLPPHHNDANPQAVSAIETVPGHFPRTSESESIFLRSITTEEKLLEAERRVAEQVAKMKHQRQNAQLQQQVIQKMMASKKDEEEIESVLNSAKVIKEQKELFRKWQADQENLKRLKEEEMDLQHQLTIANDELMPMLASHRTLKQALEKVVLDEKEHEKVIEELNWLESEERGAAEGLREPITQEEAFRLDFLTFKKQSWEENVAVRHKREQAEKAMYAETDLAVNKQRQHVSMLKSDLEEAQERVAAVESACEELCDRCNQLLSDFSRLPTTRHPTAHDQNPDSLGTFENDQRTNDGILTFPRTEEKEEVEYVQGCNNTHGFKLPELQSGFATEFYYIGEDIEEEGPNVDDLKPDATIISQVMFVDYAYGIRLIEYPVPNALFK